MFMARCCIRTNILCRVSGDGLLAFQATEDGKYGYLHTDGTIAIQPQYTAALPFSEGRAVINTAADYGNAYGLIDKQGKMIIPAVYYEVQQLGENRVALGTPLYADQPYRGSSYVIADALTGRILSTHPLLGVNNYQQGLASVYDAKDTYFIDTSGKKAAQPPVIAGSGSLSFSGSLIRADIDLRTSYYDRKGKQVWRQNGVIPLRPPYSVLEKKYKPNRDYLVYYPVVEGIAVAEVSKAVNDKLRILSLPYGAGTGGGTQDFSYTGISPSPSSVRICWCLSLAVIIFRSALRTACLPGSMSISTCAPVNSTRSVICSSPAANMCRSSVTSSASRLRMIRSIPMFSLTRIKALQRISPFMWMRRRFTCILPLMRLLLIQQDFQPSAFPMQRLWA